MADVAMGNLRFDLTADNTQFMAAVKQAKEAQNQAAAEMGSKFADAAQQSQRSLMQMAEAAGAKVVELTLKLQQLGKAAGDVWNKGAEGAEKATTDGFNKLFTFLEGGATALLAKLGGIWGKVAAGLLMIVQASGAWDAGWEALKKKAAGAIEGMFSKETTEKATKSIRDGLVYTAAATNGLVGGLFDQGTLDEQQKRVATWADGIQNKLNEMVEGARTALQKIAGTFEGISDEVKKGLAALEEQNRKSSFANSLLGLSEGEKQRQRAISLVEDQSGKKLFEMNEAEREKTLLVAAQAKGIAEYADNYRKAEQEAKAYAATVDSVSAALRRQGAMALASAGRNQGKSAYDRGLEEANALIDSYGRGKISGLGDNEYLQQQARQAAQDKQTAANRAYVYEQQRMLVEAQQKSDLDQSSLGATPGAAEKLRVEMELMNKARREGVTLDANQIALNTSIAESMGRIAQATAEARERFEAFREVGRTVASSLEDAFGRFIGGTQVQWKEFIAGLQADLAKLAFKKGIESLLLGTATGGGGLMAGLAGLFGGFKAEGGSVGSGKSYIVGERGPEMFVPQSAGSIVSNQALMGGGGGSTNITMRVDLTGANGDETIARISAAAARQAALAAVQQSNDGFAMRQRRLTMLGT